ncbi:MAG: hypothetical protein FWF69_08925 [Firmicutes bacterium]|nr:hypothetical protein [Bacillota bacterium]
MKGWRIPVQSWRFTKATRAFLQQNAERGVLLRDRDAPKAIAGIRKLVIDAPMIMEGWNAVRMVAAPLDPCDLERFRRQSSWMMLTAGVALGCDDYAPLEEFARELNFARERMARQYPKVSALPYDEARRIETTVHRDAGGLRAYAKGEPEAVLNRCAQVLDGQARPLDSADRERALASTRRMEAQGLLTLGFATKWLEAPGPYEEDMIFLGVVGMGDLVKPEVPAAVDALHSMDVRPVLVTQSSLPDGAVRASGLGWPGAGILRQGALETLEGAALRRAARETAAFLEVPKEERSRVLRALRAEDGVAALNQTQEGGVTLSFGREAVGEAFLPGGGLEAVAGLIQSCRELINKYIV